MNRDDVLREQARRMSEDQLLRQVRTLARSLGYHTYHPLQSRGSEPGWPDLVIAGHGHVLFRELKREQGRTTPAQDTWLALLTAAGHDTGIWRPTDLLHGVIHAQLRAPRTQPFTGTRKD